MFLSENEKKSKIKWGISSMYFRSSGSCTSLLLLLLFTLDHDDNRIENKFRPCKRVFEGVKVRFG